MPVAGVHPLILRRHRQYRRQRAPGSDLLVPVSLVMLFLLSFACGLRWIDRHYAVPAATLETAPEFREAEDSAFGGIVRAVLGIPTAQAAAPYWGVPLARTIDLTLAPGEEREIELKFRNTGTVTWTPESGRFFSVYTIRPRYHAAAVRHPSWMSSSQPARINGLVRTGETGSVRFFIRAPITEGLYEEAVQLASENTSWVWGAYATLRVRVLRNSAAVSAPTPAPATLASAQPDSTLAPLRGQLSYVSAERIEAPGGMQMTMRATFRNLGDAPWKRPVLRLLAAVSADGSDVDVTDDSWASPELVAVKNELIMPNQAFDLYFTLRTPKKSGAYDLRFALAVDGATLESSPIVLPIRVISDELVPPGTIPAPASAGINSGGTQTAPVPLPVTASGDPVIRVGLFTTEKQEEIGSDGPFEARTVSGATLARFSAGTRVRFWYDLGGRVYRFTAPGVDLSSATPVRFVQTGSAAYFTLWSFERRPRWNTSLNDNTFRGAIEIRKNDRNDYVWVIDELPMELYLRGMGETSNISPIEFQKALAVAARTYAYWHWTNPGKHWHFTVDATYDQVYLGYSAELRLPRWVGAIDSTRGEVVTYAGKLAVTPYFSSSDGRTRAWTEVWGGGDKPWLRSVICVHDAAAGRPLFGHGVGMSAWDAIGRANAGEAYSAILKYYYSGTELLRAY